MKMKINNSIARKVQLFVVKLYLDILDLLKIRVHSDNPDEVECYYVWMKAKRKLKKHKVS